MIAPLFTIVIMYSSISSIIHRGIPEGAHRYLGPSIISAKFNYYSLITLIIISVIIVIFIIITVVCPHSNCLTIIKWVDSSQCLTTCTCTCTVHVLLKSCLSFVFQKTLFLPDSRLGPIIIFGPDSQVRSDYTYFSLSIMSVTGILSTWSISGRISGCGFFIFLLDFTRADFFSFSIDDNRLAMCSCFLFCWS